MKRPLRLGEGMRDEQGWHATDCQPIVSRRSIRVRQIHKRSKTLRILVGATGFEPATPCAQGRCATRLRYAPTSPRSYAVPHLSVHDDSKRPPVPNPLPAYARTHTHRRMPTRREALKALAGLAWQPTTPGPRAGHALAYHAGLNATCLIGGDAPDGPDTRLWLWNCSTWTQRAQKDTPPATSLVVAVSDLDRRSTLTFGGVPILARNRYGSPTGELRELSANGTWRKHVADGPQPGPRHHHAAAFDSARGRLVLYGGDRDHWSTDVGNGTANAGIASRRPTAPANAPITRWPSTRTANSSSCAAERDPTETGRRIPGNGMGGVGRHAPTRAETTPARPHETSARSPTTGPANASCSTAIPGNGTAPGGSRCARAEPTSA